MTPKQIDRLLRSMAADIAKTNPALAMAVLAREYRRLWKKLEN